MNSHTEDEYSDIRLRLDFTLKYKQEESNLSSADDLRYFITNAYKHDRDYREQQSHIDSLLSRDLLSINDEWNEHLLSIEENEEQESECDNEEFKAFLHRYNARLKSKTFEEWFLDLVRDEEYQLEEIKENSIETWNEVIRNISAIDNITREQLKKFAVKDTNLFNQSLESANKLSNENFTSDEIILFLNKDKKYFHHINNSPEIYGFSLYEQVVIFNDLEKDPDDFCYYINLLASAFDATSSLLDGDYYDAIPKVMKLSSDTFYLYHMLVTGGTRTKNLYTTEDFKKAGSTGGIKKSKKYDEAKRTIKIISNKFWEDNPSLSKEMIAQEILQLMKNDPESFGLEKPTGIKLIKDAIGPSRRSSNDAKKQN